MKKHKFNLKESEIFIELNKILQIFDIAQTGGHAKILIQNGEVSVNNEIENRVRRKLIKNDKVLINNILILIN